MTVYDISEKMDHNETHSLKMSDLLYTVAVFKNSVWSGNFAIDSGDSTF